MNGSGWTVVPFHVNGGSYRLTSSQSVYIARCDACEEPFGAEVGGRREAERLDLPAGVYALQIRTASHRDPRVTLSLVPEVPEPTTP